MRIIARIIWCCAACLVVTLTAAAQARRPDPIGDETGRDAVGFRKDAITKETLGDRRDHANTPTTKQAIEDFMQIQKSNRQLKDLAQQKPLVLEEIVAAATEVSTRAKRLKTSLFLPPPPKELSKTGIAASASADELLDRIKDLDANIKAFVTNPIFRQMTDAGRDLPMEASVSLNRVIALSNALRQDASKLRH
jgi:hypothetical protein